MVELSRLEYVNLRDIWENEALHFTPWFAQEHNLSLLARELRLSLCLEDTELSVGDFRADILCRESVLNKLVLIENQLEPTDHTHLGQLLTYAAGLEASIIIWICREFREEHRLAIDWINQKAGGNIHFFGVEVQVVKIDDSLPASKFRVVCQPNEWNTWIAQAIKMQKTSEMSKTQDLYFQYWSDLEFFAKTKNNLRSYAPGRSNYLSFPSGKSNAVFAAKADIREKFISVEVYFEGESAKSNFAKLFEQKDRIEAEIGSPLDWQLLPERTASRILLKFDAINIEQRDDWEAQHTLLCDSLKTFQSVFIPRIVSTDLK
jgi:hypothetical protein